MSVEVTPLTTFQGDNSGSVHTLTLPEAVPVGDHLLVAVLSGDAGGAPAASWIGDPRGNTWQLEGSEQHELTHWASLFSARAVTAYQAGDVITVTMNAPSFRRSAIARAAGLTSTAWLDKVAPGEGEVGNPMTVGPTGTLAQADELVVALFASRETTGEWAPGAGYTTIHADVGGLLRISWEYKIVGSTAAVSADGSYGSPTQYAAVLATYKDAGAALPGDPDITTTSLPGGTVGSAYNQTLTATGGATPYTWALADGDLPPGLTLSSGGVISGDLTAAGTYEFTVEVTDANSNTDTQLLAIVVSSGGGAAIFQSFLGASWAFFLCDRMGVRLQDISELATAKKMSFRLSKPAQCTFRVPSNHAKIAALHTDGRPMLAPMRVLKAYRTFNGVTSLRYVGFVWLLHDEGDELAPVTTVTCHDPAQKLGRVFLRAPDPFPYRRALSFTNTNAGTIVNRLVERANGANAAITGLSSTSEVDPTIPTLSIALEFRTVGDVLNELAGTVPFDWRVLPLDGTDGVHGRLDMDALMKPGGPGNPSRPQTILGWGTGPANVAKATRVQDVSALANSLRVYGGSGVRKEKVETDASSQTTHGVFEDLALYDSITLNAYLEQIASLQLALRKQPRELVALTPTQGAVHPWADFDLGDTFSLHVSASMRGGFSGIARIYGWDLDVDDTGNEQLSTLVVSPE